jgi:hypothetical protein
MVVLTIYVVVMSRWCQQRDMVVKVISDGRFRPELESMVGLIASFSYLRLEVRDTYSFLDLLRLVEQEFYSANDHRDFDRIPLFAPDCDTNLDFNWLPAYTHWWPMHEPQVHPGQVRLQPFPFAPSFPVEFLPYFSDTGTCINLFVQYRTDLFSTGTIERLGNYTRSLAKEASGRPSNILGSISSEAP